MNLYKTDKARQGMLPLYQWTYRRLQSKGPLWLFYNVLHRVFCFMYNCDFSRQAKIGKGLYIGHPYCIVLNPRTVIGDNCNLHKGVTIGRESRGPREGVPVIGNNVWIGINSTLVGNIKIGDDVMIAPNSFVNCDVPPHSVVVGNPCTIHPRANATEAYILNPV